MNSSKTGSPVQSIFIENIWQEFLKLEKIPQLDKWLARHFKTHKKYGKRDRKFYSDQMFSALRYGYQIAFLDFSSKNDPATFEKKFPGPADIFAYCKRIPPAKFFAYLPEAEKLESPEILMPHYFHAHLAKRKKQSQWSESETKKFITNQYVRPPIWVRLNYPDKKKAFEIEARELGFQVQVHPQLPATFCLKGNASLYNLPGYKAGLFEIQDLSSQQIGFSLPLKKGDFVWDACAGAGGKTMQIASQLVNTGAIYATDERERVLEKLRQRVKRTDLSNVRSFVHDATKEFSLPKEVQKRGGFDVVLVDAPCTSSGTWRRNPEGKLRLSPDSIERLADLQKRILLNASEHTKAGGYLVYATCSWFVEENEGVIGDFLQNRRNFDLEKQDLVGSPLMDSDTMFVAVLKKTP